MRNSSSNFREFLILFLVGATGTFMSESFANQRYPWDKRPATCIASPPPSTPECTLDNWPSFEETVRRLQYLYDTERFALLELALADLTQSKKTFVSGKSTASAVYWAFRYLLPAPGTNENEQYRIKHWKDKAPGSHFAVFADARYQYGMAWNVRGSGYGASVSPESWELYGARLRQAEQTLIGAPQALKDTPLWDNLLLAIGLDSKVIANSPQAVFERAIKRYPRHFDFYELVLTRMTPKWGGSWDTVESFIDKWSQQQVSTEGTSMYARLYISLLTQGVTPNETAMNWPKMKRSLEDLVKRYPDPRFKNLQASYACFARDKALFNGTIGTLPKHELKPSDWLPGHSYEACVRWAES